MKILHALLKFLTYFAYSIPSCGCTRIVFPNFCGCENENYPELFLNDEFESHSKFDEDKFFSKLIPYCFPIFPFWAFNGIFFPFFFRKRRTSIFIVYLIRLIFGHLFCKSVFLYGPIQFRYISFLPRKCNFESFAKAVPEFAWRGVVEWFRFFFILRDVCLPGFGLGQRRLFWRCCLRFFTKQYVQFK